MCAMEIRCGSPNSSLYFLSHFSVRSMADSSSVSWSSTHRSRSSSGRGRPDRSASPSWWSPARASILAVLRASASRTLVVRSLASDSARRSCRGGTEAGRGSSASRASSAGARLSAANRERIRRSRIRPEEWHSGGGSPRATSAWNRCSQSRVGTRFASSPCSSSPRSSGILLPVSISFSMSEREHSRLRLASVAMRIQFSAYL
mmetsp:Transcript_47055/g.91847  ORF Transcript_47055/g.91847 Transcript_47055/m.91847 type:complete len:204 (-) Transcript_47055:249-860(-)